MKPFKIYDWACNEVNFGKYKNEFESFEDAWDFIYNVLDHLSDAEFEEACHEYQVLELK